MANLSQIVVVFVVSVVVVLLPATTTATDYVVGDDSGWTINYDYQAWAKDKVFRVGDRLVFTYDKDKHNVFKVNASSFASCTVPPTVGLTSGHDVVPLMASGKKWYICGKPDHCAEYKQKLVINVEEGWMAPAPAPSSGIKYGYRAFMAIFVIFAIIIMF